MYYFVSFFRDNNIDYPSITRFYCREMLCKYINGVYKQNHRNNFDPITKIQIQITEAPIVPKAYVNFLKTELGIESYANSILTISGEIFTIQKLSLILLLLTRNDIIYGVRNLPEITFEIFIKNVVPNIIPSSSSTSLLSLLGFYFSKYKVKGRPILSLNTKYPRFFINGIATYVSVILKDPKKLIKCQSAVVEFMKLTGISSLTPIGFYLHNRYVQTIRDYLNLSPQDLE